MDNKQSGMSKALSKEHKQQHIAYWQIVIARVVIVKTNHLFIIHIN